MALLQICGGALFCIEFYRKLGFTNEMSDVILTTIE